MDIEWIEFELRRLSEMVDIGQFDEALNGVEKLYGNINEGSERNAVFYIIVSNIASIFVDVGHMKPCVESTQKGMDILDQYKDKIAEQIGEDAYFYNLSNAKSNLITEKNPFNHTFSTIEQLVEVKKDLWKAIKSCGDTDGAKTQPTYVVNLGNSLKQQFRISEALDCYERVNSLNLDIPQSWINRSETLMMLNQVSNTYSIQMLEQIKNGYENVLSSQRIPPSWLEHYRQQVASHQAKIIEACKDAENRDGFS